jgi:hypothetical protein
LALTYTFDSSNETDVLRCMKPGSGQFRIEHASGKPYEPGFISLENPSNTNRGNALTFAEPRRGRGDRVGCHCRISVRARGRILRVCSREKAMAFVETLGQNIMAVFFCLRLCLTLSDAKAT